MPTVNTIYEGELRTQATHVASSKTIITDAPLDNHGRGEAFSPTDLTCASLASCMMTLMGIAANRMEIDLKGMQAETTKHMASDPRRIIKIEINFTHPNPEGISEKDRTILKRAALTCPVALSLHPDIEQAVSFNF